MFPQIFGKYVLEREIAAGGMARVLLATLRGAGGFEKRLIVKQIRPELASDQSFIGRFVAEAKTAVELSHANIVPVYELGVEQGTYYIAMEFCQGLALSQLLAQGPLTPAEGAYIGVEICRALDYAHRKAGIVHRDVTPRNVMIDPEGMVRLIDFGIAAPVTLAGAPSGAAVEEPLFGSPGHMPPEQLRRGPLTPAADVFAVATLLVEAWTGTAPFRRETLEASVRALSEPIAALEQLDAALAQLVPLLRSALALAPAARPQTAEEMARPLREFLRSSDLGDIARRLGERVSTRLTRPPDAQRPPGATDGALRSTGAGVTQTFAARDALLEWTAKIESHPPPEPAAAAGASPISGVVIESGALPARAAAPRAARRGAARVLGALSAFAVIALSGLWLAQRARDARAARATAAPSGAVTASSVPSPSAGIPSATAPRASAAVMSNSSPAAPPASAPAVPARPAPRAPSAGGEARLAASEAPVTRTRVRVHVTADPPALITVDGTAQGRTPLRALSLSPGPHSFVFVSELLGEKLESRLQLRAGTAPRIHADFTSAAPQVYLR